MAKETYYMAKETYYVLVAEILLSAPADAAAFLRYA